MSMFLDEDGYVDQHVCRFYLNSKCRSGDNCSFLHCKELGRTKITWVCLHYVGSSGCAYGANCKFDHPSWASGMYLLPQICSRYRYEKDGNRCKDQDCQYLHFTDEEHEAYIKDRIIPDRFDRTKKHAGRLVMYSSDEEEHPKGDSRSKDRSSRNHQHESERDRSRSPKRVRSKSPRQDQSWIPARSSSHPKRDVSPQGDTRRIQKMKRTIKDLKIELDDLWNDKNLVQRELADHKRFHDSDQELINDLMRAREKLEEDVGKLNNEKLQMSKQISDLFSDNKVVVEENQRLRGLLKQAQDTQPRVQAAPQTIPPMAQSNYLDNFSTSSNASAVYQTTWN